MTNLNELKVVEVLIPLNEVGVVFPKSFRNANSLVHVGEKVILRNGKENVSRNGEIVNVSNDLTAQIMVVD